MDTSLITFLLFSSIVLIGFGALIVVANINGKRRPSMTEEEKAQLQAFGI